MRSHLLCDTCKDERCQEAMEGRVIMPVGTMTLRGKWNNCKNCGKRFKYGWIVREPEDEAETDSS